MSWNGEAYACEACGAIHREQGGPTTPNQVVTKADIIAYAETLMGVPYVHLGRSVENGIDCIGLLRLVAHRFNLTDHDFTNYAPTADGKTLIRELDLAFGVDDGDPRRVIEEDEYEPGDVLVFYIRRRKNPTHAGIFVRLEDGRPGLLHTYANVKKVTIHGMNDWWVKRIVKVYKWPGVE